MIVPSSLCLCDQEFAQVILIKKKTPCRVFFSSSVRWMRGYSLPCNRAAFCVRKSLTRFSCVKWPQHQMWPLFRPPSPPFFSPLLSLWLHFWCIRATQPWVVARPWWSLHHSANKIRKRGAEHRSLMAPLIKKSAFPSGFVGTRLPSPHLKIGLFFFFSESALSTVPALSFWAATSILKPTLSSKNYLCTPGLISPTPSPPSSNYAATENTITACSQAWNSAKSSE